MKYDLKFSLIIPVHRSGRGLGAFSSMLDSCLNQVGIEYECIVVSNLSDPDLRKYVEEKSSIAGKIKYFEVGKIGVNRARNMGALFAKGEFFYFLDDDCELPRNTFLSELYVARSAMEKNSILGGGYSGGRNEALSLGYNALVNAWIHCGMLDRNIIEHNELIRTKNLVGGNFCIHRDSYFCSPFEEEILFGGDETRFFRKLNSPMYFSERFSVYHRNHETLGKVIRRAWAHGSAWERYDLVTPRTSCKKTFAWFGFFKREKRLLLISLIHFPVLLLSVQAEKFKKLAKAVRNVCAEEQVE